MHPERSNTIFDRNPKTTITIAAMVIAVVVLVLTEIILQKVIGLGDPVLYDTYPVYGYRPLPNREYVRLHGAHIKFNNLALRANQDWDDNKANKILFLGDSVTYGGSGIDNSELFTQLAAEHLGKGYMAGNAGVNAWGIENIHGLVVGTGFYPARTYVTMAPELDYYRGLVRFQGLPFFNTSPGYGLAELWYVFTHQQNSNRYVRWRTLANAAQEEIVVGAAVRKLKEMDNELRARGYTHLILISPTKFQVLEGAPVDLLLRDKLAEQGLSPVYLLDDINELALDNDEKQRLFVDLVHLSKAGHQLWGSMIANHLRPLLQ